MISRDVIVTAEEGLHARPAAVLTNTCQKFKCDIVLEKDGQTIDPKSILGIMMLSAKKGDSLVLTTNGDDEVEAMEAIESLFKKGFEE